MKKLIVLLIAIVFVLSGFVLNADKTPTVKKDAKIEKKLKKKGCCDTIVYVKEKGKKYHKKNCKLVKEKKGIKLCEAAKKGYTPCAKCKPADLPKKGKCVDKKKLLKKKK